MQRDSLVVAAVHKREKNERRGWTPEGQQRPMLEATTFLIVADSRVIPWLFRNIGRVSSSFFQVSLSLVFCGFSRSNIVRITVKYIAFFSIYFMIEKSEDSPHGVFRVVINHKNSYIIS